MAVKKYNPTTAGRRMMSVTDFSVLDKKVATPKALLVYKSRSAGRNGSGKITVRHHGGGSRKIVRLIDFSRKDLENIPGKVQTIEYDPNRTAFISLIAYKNGVKRYILTPQGLKVGSDIIFGKEADILPGNRLPLENIPVGTSVNDIEIVPGAGGKIARSAGSFATITANEAGYTLIKLPSSEMRKVRSTCLATVGQLSNSDWMNVRIGKAGRSRHMGIRPSVRGKVMNPVDHPHGGGEGHNPIGMKYPKTPWGKHALGVKTRRSKNTSKNLIIKRRTK